MPVPQYDRHFRISEDTLSPIRRARPGSNEARCPSVKVLLSVVFGGGIA